MSDSQPLSTMSTYTARKWTLDETIDAPDLNDTTQGEYFNIDALIDEIKIALADIQNCRATSNHTPTDNDIAGQIAFDTTLDQWFGDPDGSGADDEILTRLTAYLVDCATAGSDTFRIGGPLNVDTTQVALAGSTGVLESYTLPAGTLARDGQYVHTIISGTKTNANASASIQIRFNTGVQHTFTLAAATTDWTIEWWIIRTGATAQDFSAYIVLNSDATGLTDLTKTGTDGETLANALAIDANLSAVNASDTVTKEIMITELGNY